jgi:ankyrin repeat protein
MTAASLGNLKLVEELLKLSTKISKTEPNGRTALHYAASVGALQIFELLMTKGADPNCQTIGGETPLMKAVLFSQANIIEWYLNNSIDSFTAINGQGETALQILGKLNRSLQKEV